MDRITFDELAAYLRDGREIEFGYQDRKYSITNHSGFWYLCDDTAHSCLETVCRFEEKEILVSKAAAFVLEDLTIAEIFDQAIYDEKELYIL